MPGEVLGVVGELGAGKTHLTQGIMEGLGSSDAAASPTFSLVHEHADGRLRACHFDFYRLKDESELLGIGWDEYLDGDAVLIVEWANLFPDALPEGTSWLLLEHEGECLRRVSLAPVE
ncbi:MAG: tRNA (adenosine(37)-N6)-threonylcarbamoyltransferase complex ATPase subunit type 1 TsaE [Akkermansia sp.]|nr:tRNA (adenosine(37)-N6)-threonylcarbamoyltransferase complex ATPase subunit type 1 TsaE [Akkermansia sp.]